MAQTMAPPPAPAPVPTRVYNLDHEGDFSACEARLKEPATENFAVRFDDAVAECAVDLDQREVLGWVRRDEHHRQSNQTLWLNFWASESQRATVEALAAKYGLSPRLTGLLCPTTTTSQYTAAKVHIDDSQGSSVSTASRHDGSPRLRSNDIEMGAHAPSRVPIQGVTAPDTSSEMTFSAVVKKLWHFCSVDFGRRYVYVGFNSLFFLPERAKPNHPRGTLATSFAGAAENAHEPADNRPSGERIWSSLLICDDGTIISVFERPARPEAHAATRRNVLNVFHHLSRQHFEDGKQDALMKVRVRWKEQTSSPSTGYDANEASSLLMYYLFDDWESTYKLIARVEHPYRTRLLQMRDLMFEAADVEHVKQVHEIGTQLTVLKLMYQSYELIVSRLLHNRRSARAASMALLSPRHASHERGFNPGPDTPASELPFRDDIFLEGETESNVKLSSSAVVRFERLLDRIRLYALTEIEECIKEKESLVLMNFNLVALKESQAVERLTRTTILLAKATILFLPVSLMTGYFSIQLDEINEKYSLKTYWMSFLVVGILSVLFLLVFGVTTHTLEGKTVYRSVTRTIGRTILNAAGTRKRKAH